MPSHFHNKQQPFLLGQQCLVSPQLTLLLLSILIITITVPAQKQRVAEKASMHRRSSVRFPLREKQKSTDEQEASERFLPLVGSAPAKADAFPLWNH